jgi:hypothetical protein
MVLTHVLFDFYFQTNKCVDNKKYNSNLDIKKFVKAHVLHAAYHSIAITIVVALWYFFDDKIPKCDDNLCIYPSIFFKIAAIVFVTHMVIDISKEVISNRFEKYKASIFVADQMLHLFFIFWIATHFFHTIPYQKSSSNIHNELVTFVVLITAFLILIKPTSIFIYLFITSKKIGGSPGKIKITKSVLASAYYADVSKIYSEANSSNLNNIGVVLGDSKIKAESVIAHLEAQNLDVDSQRAFLSNDAGKWIGYIERSMIFMFFIFNQAAAIAVIMAIKTAFRFNDLKDDNDSARSEYIMIGTFLSFFITMIVAGVADFSIKSIWDGVEYKILDFNIMVWVSKYIYGF